MDSLDTVTAIRAAFARERREHKTRHRDIADKLRLSEAELIAHHAGARTDDSILHAQRLRPEWSAIIGALAPVGKLMALTRNASCVHEKKGVYDPASVTGHVGLVLGGAIDLRLFYSAWAHGFAVSEEVTDGVQRSLQFFDGFGTAVHKIFMQADSDLAAWEAVIERFSAEEQSGALAIKAAALEKTETPDAAIDVAGMRAAWASMRDTHEFFGLLRKFGVTRTQALRLASPEFVQEVEPDAVSTILHGAASEGVAIMVFVGNPGVIQIHSGVIHKVVVMGPWLNVLDPLFNLHLREDHVARAWVVKKPTVDGIVTSLELFDAQGETIAMLFGERKPGKPELCEWRALVERLQDEVHPCAA